VAHAGLADLGMCFTSGLDAAAQSGISAESEQLTGVLEAAGEQMVPLETELDKPD